MFSVHRETVNRRKEKFIEQLIARFAIEQPRSQFYLITTKMYIILTYFIVC
jgi:hypothetical protein